MFQSVKDMQDGELDNISFGHDQALLQATREDGVS